jgi:(p)ppGpp synthase/HD superfamily hydrolase
MDIVTKAREAATEYFKDITEKNKEKTPYIFHLERVANLVKESGGSDIEVAAAWLHDIVEDTPMTMDELVGQFGAEVAVIVDRLTDPADYSGLTVEEKKQRQADRLIKESDSVRRVKLADQISAVEIDSRNSLLTVDHRQKYIDGAKKISQICSGISEFLDIEFLKVFSEAESYLKDGETKFWI